MEPEITTPDFGTGRSLPQRFGDELQVSRSSIQEAPRGLGGMGASLDDTPADVAPDATRADRRRAWVCRAVLGLIMVVQALLSTRLHNTAFMDEALYIYAGHAEFAHLLHGASVNSSYSSTFSGSPVLYPLLAGAMDSLGGLTGARALSLVFMLGCTGLLYSLTRRLFNERVGLFAAVLFVASQSTIVLGWFATFDSAALFLLAFAAWVVVRTDRANPFTVLFAAPILVLAFCTKYAAGLFIPTVVVLAVIVAWPHRGARALWRGVLLSAAVAAIGGTLLYGSSLLSGIQFTTTSRAHGTSSTSALIDVSADWIGLAFALACWGALSYVWRGRIGEVTSAARKATGEEPGRVWRAMLSLLLCGTGLLAPAYQMHLSTSVSLHKHVGFGLFFFAPLAGLGLSRIVGPYFHRTAIGVGLLIVRTAIGLLFIVLALSNGIEQSQWRYATWPDSTRLVNLLRPHVNSQGRYLSDIAQVPTYYFRDITKWNQWTGTYHLNYTDTKGVKHTGAGAFAAAIDDGRYNFVVLQKPGVSKFDPAIAKALATSAKYRLYAELPFTTTFGDGSYQVWTRTS
ncbi:phospholipid carrier-dependent glycosyltransferase [Sphaerisporangium album]|uniref:Phospholipid carrier-dependent glycosyltransferase n=1 Tax=Sphaerisporangium album TaxID=509200 RepID=A0A367FQU4_9ACTN|nr:glycosyltransferase family 39 protein [Sphaerisporangium album]RCG32604.1 phospholipid carrier-dependent glycosyltransferase [Sphaerisporangium album]